MENDVIFPNQKIIDVELKKEMEKSFLDYSMSVIVSRALPDIRDGLKPVHRRILYNQFESNLTPDKPYKKCAATVGDVLGKYHPHGDASVYDALVRLAQDFSMRYMLVDGHGNFGSVDGDPPAAYRYTESKMSKIALEMLTDINKDTVDFVSNYDDTEKEPVVLPSRFPNVLVNGSTGIAVGMATNIPPHNLGETIDAVCYVIDNPDATLDEIMDYIQGPDFPTAGIIMGKAGIRAAYGTGRGKITVRAKTEIVEEKNGRFKIFVTELPYQVNKAKLIESIAEYVKDKKIEGISNIEDHSDKDGMLIQIDIKRDASPQIVLNKLFSYTQMQITFGAILLAIVNGEPKILTLKQIIEHYIDFQAEVIYRRTSFNLKKAEERAHILEGLKIAIDNIDEIVKIIRSSKDKSEAKGRICERFGLDDVQAEAIVQMRLVQLTNLERGKIEEEIAELLKKIAEYREILASRDRQLGIVKDELLDIRNRFADPRRTEICSVSGEVDIEDLIPSEDCVFTMTDYGYVKRQSTENFKLQRRGGRGITGLTRREEDVTKSMFVVNTHDYILFFTNFGKVYRLKCYEISEGSRNSKGVNIVNLLPLEAEEKVSSMIKVTEFTDDKYLVMVTKKGLIKRISLNAYNTSRKGGLIALDIEEGDELCWVRMTSGNDDVVVATQKGMSIRFNENEVRPTGRNSKGVKAITLKKNDNVICMEVVEKGGYILTVSETGYGRLSSETDYHCQSRGGKGSTNYHTEKYGDVATISTVQLDEDVILVSENGIIIRIPASSIRICAKPSKGVTLMRIEDGNKIISLSHIKALPNQLEDLEADTEVDTEQQ